MRSDSIRGWIPVRVKKTGQNKKLDGLPRPEAGAAMPDLAGAIGRLRIRQRSPPQATGLRRPFGGRDQLGDEGRIGRGAGLGDQRTDWVTGTSSVQAGSSRLTNSPSKISSDRSISSIAHRNRNRQTVTFWDVTSHLRSDLARPMPLPPESFPPGPGSL